MTQEIKSISFRHKIISVLKWYYEFTSIAGITQTRDTNSKISKWAWLILTIFALVLTQHLVNKSIQTYLDHETVTKIGIKSASKLDFPSVTICNQNRVHCRNLYNLIQNCTKVRISNLCYKYYVHNHYTLRALK